ncbi:energy transducer TonB [Paludibacteraceae bacterium OttesenSCG-928-F17]|nr:energy transducer TonB [Paludibacteraceae bacterium OttesenSCG-928-F17]
MAVTYMSEEAKMNKQQGQVIVQFWVQQTGKIEDVKILRGVSKELDTEAVRLISEMPEWIPAEKAGKKMKMMHIYSVNFRLDNVKFPVSESRAENK